MITYAQASALSVSGTWNATTNRVSTPRVIGLYDYYTPAEAIYAVFYQGKPINLRTLSHLVSYPGPKYKKISFSNKGHCFNLAERMNKLFNTTEFTVVELTVGKIITELDE